MQLFVDYLPILAFVAAYFYKTDFFFATMVIMAVMPLVLVLQRLIAGKFNRIYVASTALVLILGAATLYFRNSSFMIWKPTVLNWAIAVAFLGSQFIGEKPIVQRMMESAAELSAPQWAKLNLMWIIFFIVVGAVNLYVGYNYSEPVWVKFKLFGMLGLTILFVIVQTIWLTLVMNKNEAARDEADQQGG
jgi:intracellular septation protein